MVRTRYFNTVGSKEGWAPATFKSSRTARAATKVSAPEDFMDEEDIREAEEAKVLETNRDFSGLGQTQDTPPLDFLMPAMHSTRGYTLLRKMGWKDGNLIGPKTTQWSPPATSSESAEASPGSTVESPRVFVPKRKDDAHGLGFQGDAPRSEKREPAWNSLSKSAFVPTASSASSRRKPKGSAFGVGVLNDVDDEDDDAYEIRPKTAYHSSLDPERAKSRKGALRPVAKHKFVSKKAAPSTLTVKKCHDDRLPLTGFRLSSTLDAADVLWPLPSVPDGWAPSSLSDQSSTCAPTTTQQLDPATRAKILGESPLPGKSIFSYISADSRNRLAALTGRVDLPPGLGEVPALAARPTVTSAASDLIPALESHIASAALNHPSMPYADDPDKRRRYRTFLEIKAGQRDGLPERVCHPSRFNITLVNL